jgi:AAA ATPase-like protein
VGGEDRRDMELLERASVLDALGSLLAEARAGSGRLALVSGEAGVGKTSLVRELCARKRHAARVLWGACDPLSTPRPLGPLADIAPAAGGRLEELLREEAPREVLFPPCSNACDAAHPRASWSSRTCTGPTRPPWTCSGSWPGGSAASRS